MPAVSRHKAGNFRPVNLTSVLWKFLEGITKDHSCCYLANNRLLMPMRHGIVKRNLCLRNLLKLFVVISRLVDWGKIVGVCLPDFTRAFNFAIQFLLNQKLPDFGLITLTKMSVRQFLSHRDFRVCIGNHKSGAGVTGRVIRTPLVPLFIDELEHKPGNPCSILVNEFKLAGKVIFHESETVRRFADCWNLKMLTNHCWWPQP